MLLPRYKAYLLVNACFTFAYPVYMSLINFMGIFSLLMNVRIARIFGFTERELIALLYCLQ